MNATNNLLADHLCELIDRQGPLSIADYMDICLGHPDWGYYRRQDPLGRAGDFITAPEISQMFGELIGLWCADQWLRAGQKPGTQLVELGPGRGTLMADALRAAALVPGFTESTQVHFVETSPALRTEQAKRVTDASWHDHLDQVPPGPLLLIANEFFDALPIRQFIRTDRGWCERHVTKSGAGRAAPTFTITLGQDPVSPDLLPVAVRDAPKGSMAEICPAAENIIRDLAARLRTDGGAALIIDYGHTKSAPGDTLQAVRNHKFADPFTDPGDADLTAHVDFAALVSAALSEDARVDGPVTQRDFLIDLGIETRAETLRTKTPAAAAEINAALERLIGEAEMGTLFKVLALTGLHEAPPAGFGKDS